MRETSRCWKDAHRVVVPAPWQVGTHKRDTVGLPVAWGCLPDPILQPNRGKWHLQEAALPPARICVHSFPTLCPKQALPRQADHSSLCPHHPVPPWGRMSRAAPQLPPRVCSWKDTHTHTSGIWAFFRLGTKFFQR